MASTLSLAKTAVFVLILAILTIATISPAKTSALSGSGFNPGRIIDDLVFFDKDTMTPAQIQQFFDAKVPTCWRNHPSYTGGSGTVYNPPFTCLKEYQENPTTRENNIGRFNPDGSPYSVPGGKTAAQIIWEVGQEYSINPQVLIVMLQKEQGLVTDDWPVSAQYKIAMGYACPDTAPCNEAYYGFYNQVSSAAWQMRRYVTNPDSYSYRAGVSRYILFNPSASCGGSNIFLENSATAILYNYTPYQPNQAALNNLYGSGDSCSAYGNRNFWRYFNDWFGSTLAPTYGWKVVSQASYEDESMQRQRDTSRLAMGDQVFVVVKIQNTGTSTWNRSSASPTRLAASSPNDRASAFREAGWIDASRVAETDELTVKSGETATYRFWYRAPAFPGEYNEFFTPVTEGKAWHSGGTFSIKTMVESPSYAWQIAFLQSYRDPLSGIHKDTRTIPRSDKAFIILKAKNTGNTTWYNSGASPVNLGLTGPIDRSSVLGKTGWVNQNRPSRMIEKKVLPGEVGTFAFWFEAPLSDGDLNERFNLVAEGKTWLPDPGLTIPSKIVTPSYSWRMTKQYAYTDSSKITPVSLTSLTPGQRVYVGVEGINTGNIAWRNSAPFPVLLGTSSPNDRASAYCDPTWLSCSRATILATTTFPGEKAKFEFWYKAPATPMNGQESFDLLAEGFSWFNDVNLLYTSSVK